MPDTVYLVGCGKRKRATAAPARDLYTGDLFRKSLQLAERQADGDPVYILSAEYGLVHPDEILEPYDLALQHLSAARRLAWGAQVARALLDCHAGEQPPVWARRIVVYASHLYASHVARGLQEVAGVACRIEEPLMGLFIGQRRAWLKAALADLEVDDPLEDDVDWPCELCGAETGSDRLHLCRECQVECERDAAEAAAEARLERHPRC